MSVRPRLLSFVHMWKRLTARWTCVRHSWGNNRCMAMKDVFQDHGLSDMGVRPCPASLPDPAGSTRERRSWRRDVWLSLCSRRTPLWCSSAQIRIAFYMFMVFIVIRRLRVEQTRERYLTIGYQCLVFGCGKLKEAVEDHSCRMDGKSPPLFLSKHGVTNTITLPADILRKIFKYLENQNTLRNK